jgi:hypothetical protein
MEITKSKIAGLAVALVYVVIGIVSECGLTTGVGNLCLALLFPLALIWFPDEMGAVGRGWVRINSESPGVLVAAMSWFFLVGFPLLLYAIFLMSS